MYEALKKIKSYIIKNLRIVKWSIQSTKYLMKFGEKNKSIKVIKEWKSKILIIVPHADDELVGCYQFINKHNTYCKIFYLGFTGTNLGDLNKEVRFEELKKLCAKLEIELIESISDSHDELCTILKDFKPEHIAVPSIVDWHEEHINANFILSRVLRSINFYPSILQYQISIPIPNKYITHIYPFMIDEQKIKWELFKRIYISQLNLPIERFILNEKLSGRMNGFSPVESYRISSFIEWSLKLELFEKGMFFEKTKTLKFNINNIVKSRVFSLDIFDELFLESELIQVNNYK